MPSALAILEVPHFADDASRAWNAFTVAQAHDADLGPATRMDVS